MARYAGIAKDSNTSKPSVYEKSVRRRPSTPKLSSPRAAGLAPGQTIRGIEITQVIQSLNNDVRLIAGKTTVVRVYVDPSVLESPAYVTGEITWRKGAGGASYLPAMNRVRIRPADAITLPEQRDDLEASLNFRLPDDATAVGTVEIRLNKLKVPGGDDIPITGNATRSVRFVSAPPLRVRAVGLRYRSEENGTDTVTPDALHFAYLRSFLGRGYPCAEIEWSQIVVDTDNLTPPFSGGASDLVNAQISAMRVNDLSNGFDPRTHYYGIVDDDGGDSFMRGAAVLNRITNIFGLVACGPSGVPNGWVGDTDASYADWYGAHELGHTFQRRHPGFPTASQPRDPAEPGFPYEDGRISNDDPRFLGFDVGDAALGLPMRPLPGETHHDVMTYADNQWFSQYTYEAIHDRLLLEDTVLAPATS